MPKRAFDMENAPLLNFPYDFRWKSKGAIPDTGIHESPYLYCIVIEAQWLKDVNGAISRLDEWDAWNGSEDAIEDARQQITLLQSRIHGCMILRQNPANPCQLQQSIDFGQTWTLAFDYSLCSLPMNNIILNDIYQDDLQSLIDDYQIASEDIGTLFPDLVYDNTVNDAKLDEALCFALGAYVRLVCQIASDGASDKALVTGGVAVGLGFMDLALVGFVALVPPLTLALIALSAVAIEIYAISQLNNAMDYQDEEAQQEVICCMFSNMVGQGAGNALSESDFSSGLGGCSFTGNADKISDVVSVALSDENAYLTFMNFWNEALEQQQAGVLPDCECLPEYPVLVPMLHMQYCSEISTEDYSITNNGGGSFTIGTTLSSVPDKRFMVRDAYNRPFKLVYVTSNTSSLSRRVYYNMDESMCHADTGGYPYDVPTPFFGMTWGAGVSSPTATLSFELV